MHTLKYFIQPTILEQIASTRVNRFLASLRDLAPVRSSSH